MNRKRYIGLCLELFRTCRLITIYFYKNTKQGLSASIIIEASIKNVILNFPWKKSMRWGVNKIKWIRPLHNILCVFDKNPLNFNIFSSSASNRTSGTIKQAEHGIFSYYLMKGLSGVIG